MAGKPTPFYIQVTPQKVDYKDSGGADKSVDLPLVTLPPGTVLFRGLKIPNPDAGEDVRYFYRDFLGDPEGKDHVCLKPTHNVFFYPFPYVAFGADTIGKTFHSMQAVVLVQPMTVVCNISPANMVRSDAYGFDGDAPYQRCDKFKTQCHTPSDKELEALRYDNCVNPTYQQQSGVRGWMAIADRDSIKPTKVDINLLRSLRKKGEKPSAKHSPMGQYLLNLEARQPGLGPMALAWMYADLRAEDKRAHAGFPELALYPYRVHPGEKTVKRTCKTQEHAITLMEREASLNNLNYLPLAAFTKDGTVDMVNGHFSYECLGVSANTFAVPASDNNSAVETKMREWMDHCQTTGLNLPFYGPGKLSFDIRTGFYVLPQILPKNIRIRLPEKDSRGRSDMPYEYLAQPLDTEQAKQRVLTYMLMFRSFIPGQFMKMYGLLPKFGVPRAMVFNRPPVLKWIFEELGIAMPKTFAQILARAATQYKENTGAKSKKDLQAEEEAARKLAMAVQYIGAGEHVFYKIYKDSGDLALQFTFDQWRALGEEEYLRILGLAGRAPSVAEKMEKQYKLKQNVPLTEGPSLTTLTPEAMAPPSSPITVNANASNSIPEEVRGKREYLFKDQIAAQNLKYIQMDETALYSVTDGKTAIEQTTLINKKLDDILGKSNQAPISIITDGTANVGGNTISFGKDFQHVNSVEIAPLRATLLANNIMVAGTQGNTTVHVGDYTKIWRSLQQNVIFMDPPWGGTNYKAKKVLDMFLGPTNVIDLIKEMVDEKAANLIAMKAPVNYNVAALKAKLPGIDVEVKEMKKQILILISVTNEIKPLGQAPTTPPLGMWGATTPPIGYGASTPPLYGAMTSGYVTPPYVATTPPYGASTPPLYGAMANGYVTPPYGSTTPPFGYSANGSTTPPYMASSPVYGANANNTGLSRNELEYYNAAKAAIKAAKESGQATPSPIYDPSLPTEKLLELYKKAKESTSPVTGGRRKTRSKRKNLRGKTRRASTRSPFDYAKAFSRVWGAHARNQ